MVYRELLHGARDHVLDGQHLLHAGCRRRKIKTRWECYFRRRSRAVGTRRAKWKGRRRGQPHNHARDDEGVEVDGHLIQVSKCVAAEVGEVDEVADKQTEPKVHQQNVAHQPR